MKCSSEDSQDGSETAQVATRSQVKELTELWEASQGGTDASNISTGSSTFAHRLEQMRRKSRDLILRPVVAVSPAALPGLQALEARFPEGHVLPVHKLLRRIKTGALCQEALPRPASNATVSQVMMSAYTEALPTCFPDTEADAALTSDLHSSFSTISSFSDYEPLPRTPTHEIGYSTVFFDISNEFRTETQRLFGASSRSPERSVAVGSRHVSSGRKADTRSTTTLPSTVQQPHDLSNQSQHENVPGPTTRLAGLSTAPKDLREARNRAADKRRDARRAKEGTENREYRDRDTCSSDTAAAAAPANQLSHPSRTGTHARGNHRSIPEIAADTLPGTDRTRSTTRSSSKHQQNQQKEQQQQQRKSKRNDLPWHYSQVPPRTAHEGPRTAPERVPERVSVPERRRERTLGRATLESATHEGRAMHECVTHERGALERARHERTRHERTHERVPQGVRERDRLGQGAFERANESAREWSPDRTSEHDALEHYDVVDRATVPPVRTKEAKERTCGSSQEAQYDSYTYQVSLHLPSQGPEDSHVPLFPESSSETECSNSNNELGELGSPTSPGASPHGTSEPPPAGPMLPPPYAPLEEVQMRSEVAQAARALRAQPPPIFENIGVPKTRHSFQSSRAQDCSIPPTMGGLGGLSRDRAIPPTVGGPSRDPRAVGAGRSVSTSKGPRTSPTNLGAYSDHESLMPQPLQPPPQAQRARKGAKLPVLEGQRPLAVQLALQAVDYAINEHPLSQVDEEEEISWQGGAPRHRFLSPRDKSGPSTMPPLHASPPESPEVHATYARMTEPISHMHNPLSRSQSGNSNSNSYFTTQHAQHAEHGSSNSLNAHVHADAPQYDSMHEDQSWRGGLQIPMHASAQQQEASSRQEEQAWRERLKAHMMVDVAIADSMREYESWREGRVKHIRRSIEIAVMKGEQVLASTRRASMGPATAPPSSQSGSKPSEALKPKRAEFSATRRNPVFDSMDRSKSFATCPATAATAAAAAAAAAKRLETDHRKALFRSRQSTETAKSSIDRTPTTVDATSSCNEAIQSSDCTDEVAAVVAGARSAARQLSPLQGPTQAQMGQGQGVRHVYKSGAEDLSIARVQGGAGPSGGVSAADQEQFFGAGNSANLKPRRSFQNFAMASLSCMSVESSRRRSSTSYSVESSRKERTKGTSSRALGNPVTTRRSAEERGNARSAAGAAAGAAAVAGAGAAGAAAAKAAAEALPPVPPAGGARAAKLQYSVEEAWGPGGLPQPSGAPVPMGGSEGAQFNGTRVPTHRASADAVPGRSVPGTRSFMRQMTQSEEVEVDKMTKMWLERHKSHNRHSADVSGGGTGNCGRGSGCGNQQSHHTQQQRRLLPPLRNSLTLSKPQVSTIVETGGASASGSSIEGLSGDRGDRQGWLRAPMHSFTTRMRRASSTWKRTAENIRKSMSRPRRASFQADS